MTQWQLANNNICCIFTDSFWKSEVFDIYFHYQTPDLTKALWWCLWHEKIINRTLLIKSLVCLLLMFLFVTMLSIW
jgi:hypothetical protein